MKYPIFKSTDIRYQYSLGGGALMDGGCYAINMMRLLLGDDLELLNTSCKTANKMPKIDQDIKVEVKNSTGSTGLIDVSMFSILPDISVKVKLQFFFGNTHSR